MPPPQLHEIYYARIEVGFADYARPFIIVEGPVVDPQDPAKTLVLIAPISSAQDSKKPGAYDIPDPHWRACGLKRISYVISKSRWLDSSAVGKRLGKLCPSLLPTFTAWSNLMLERPT